MAVLAVLPIALPPQPGAKNSILFFLAVVAMLFVNLMFMIQGLSGVL